jgi:L-aminopeptidase/D-esterase-like protein
VAAGATPPVRTTTPPSETRVASATGAYCLSSQAERARKSSIIVVVATDAPLLPSQLKRLAHRATHGIARTGTNTNDDPGELVIAFSTANLSTSIPDHVQRASQGLPFIVAFRSAKERTETT